MGDDPPARAVRGVIAAGGLPLEFPTISLGEPFQSAGYAGWFVPYEIKLKSGGTKKHNLAIRNDNPAHRFQFDGGI